MAYPHLDSHIRATYAERSQATNKNALYDSYIRAIRWASDRVGDSGVIGFVTNAGFVEANTADGLRQCLAEEFSSIYVFHLRGNPRYPLKLFMRVITVSVETMKIVNNFPPWIFDQPLSPRMKNQHCPPDISIILNTV